MGCTPKAKDLCWFIIYELNSQQDWLWINKERYMKESHVSLNTYKAAVLELDRYGILQPTVYKDTYWVNPMFFFHGDRIKKYPSKIKER